MFAALLSLAVTAAPPEQYVVATQLNLRSEPKAGGKLVYVARITEACTPQGAVTNGWLLVQCGAFRGYARAEFLAPEKPTLEKATREFEQLSESKTEAAFTAAQRLLALGAEPSSLSRFFEDYFLAQDTAASEAKVLHRVEPRIPGDSQDALASANQSVSSQLGLDALCIPTGPQRAASCISEPRVHARVLADGTAWVVAASAWDQQHTFSAHTQYHAVVSPAFAKALGFKLDADACPLAAAAPAALLCTAPAGKSCALDACHTCKLACASTCNEARLGCKLGKKWESCVKTAVAPYAACAKACDDALQCP